jgi:hypothetical protein
MATPVQVADSIMDLEISFSDAGTLHLALVNLNLIAVAIGIRLAQLSDRVSETSLKPAYAEAIREVASDEFYLGDRLQSVVGGGVLRG